MSNITLSDDQQVAFETISKWLAHGKVSKNKSDLLTFAGYAGCLSGNTVIHYSRGKRKNVRPLTLRDLYLKFNGYTVPGVRGIGNRWIDTTIPTLMYSFWPDGSVKLNKVVAVYESGIKAVIKVEFDTGKCVICTPDHPIAVPGGNFVEAGKLAIGDNVLARSTWRLEKRKGRQLHLRPPRVLVSTKYHPPGSPKIVVCNGITYTYIRVAKARLVVEAAMNGISYNEFVHCLKHDASRSAKFKYLPSNVDVHHEDENTLNDDIKNLKVLPCEMHAKIHTKERNKKLDLPKEVKVVNITPAGEEMTYDVQMESPANNFEANGVFVHNTGKTTLVSFIAKHFTTAIKFAFCALSGKASSVLRKKLTEQGLDFESGQHYCGTIHSLIYQPIENDDGEVVYWSRKDAVDCDVIVVDEASMVSEDIYEDLKQYGKPILAIGDHGQLPPISGKFNLMGNPMIKLEKIHRQAESNPIINLSMQIRTTGKLPKVKESEYIKVVNKRDHIDYIESQYSKIRTTDELMDKVVLCYKNATRTRFNSLIRKTIYGNTVARPQPDDIVICLRNSGKDRAKSKEKPPIFNGYRGYVHGAAVESGDDHYDMKVVFPYEGFAITEDNFLKHQFGFAKTFSAFSELEIFGMDVSHWKQVGLLFDYGYAMTVHKMQGSQAGTVILYNERPYMVSDDDYKRWLYTAATRSSDKLVLMI